MEEKKDSGPMKAAPAAPKDPVAAKAAPPAPKDPAAAKAVPPAPKAAKAAPPAPKDPAAAKAAPPAPKDPATAKAAPPAPKDPVAAAREAYERACEADGDMGVEYRKARAESSVTPALIAEVNAAGAAKAEALRALNEAEAAARK